MDMRRTPNPRDVPETAGHQDAAAYVRPLIESGASTLQVLVAGGFRGFTPAQMFPERAA